MRHASLRIDVYSMYLNGFICGLNSKLVMIVQKKKVGNSLFNSYLP